MALATSVASAPEEAEATLHMSAADRPAGGRTSERRLREIMELTRRDPIWQQDDED